MSDHDTFRGGPLEDGRQSQIHALHVYMAGDGMESIGYYRQVYDDDIALGRFEWIPENDEMPVVTTLAGGGRITIQRTTDEDGWPAWEASVRTYPPGPGGFEEWVKTFPSYEQASAWAHS